MEPVTRSIGLLLEGLIDYAGLFPPAQLDMQAAVRNFAEYRAGRDAWALGRFIVPSARLDEFEGAAAALFPRERDASPWAISMLGSEDPAHDAEQIFAFNERHAQAAVGRVVIDMLEVKASDVAGLERAVRSAPGGVITYVEIPLTPDPTDLISAVAFHDARAKVRTGGVTAAAVPPAGELARFIRIAADQGVPFKATAGLHHPVRGSYPLTYERGSQVAPMFGFLNVFLAAAFAQEEMSIAEIETLLTETDAAAFEFGDRGIRWGARHADLDALARLRTRVALGFGSCSFTEPLEELRGLGLL